MGRRLGATYGFGQQLECADCHVPTPDGTRFQPPDMEVRLCHSLAFETIDGTVRTLRHGEPRQVVADIRSFYRAGLRGGRVRHRAQPPGRRQPGPRRGADRARQAGTIARADQAVRQVFSPGGACFDCHQVQPAAGGSLAYGIRPVAFPTRYMLHGWFDHRAHQITQRPGQPRQEGTQACLSCHRADASSISSDLLLPNVASCRDCHGGETTRPAGVQLRDVPRLPHGRRRAGEAAENRWCGDGAGRRPSSRWSRSEPRRRAPGNRCRRDASMLIAQITDIHLGFDPINPDEFNRQRLDDAGGGPAAPQPDLLLVTGDIANDGDDAQSYQRYREALADLAFPVFPLMGNHDSRAPFLELFPEVPNVEGFIQYAIEDWPLRILVLDTLEVGRHGGGFCEIRAEWLRERLDEAPDRPTLIALHHPPIATGIGWLTGIRTPSGSPGCARWSRDGPSSR